MDRELYVRALALPGALIGAHLATAVMPGPVRMFSMWVHESGHATAAWLTGFAAFPGPWLTPIDLERSLMVTLAVVGALAAGAYRAWESERWFWVGAAGAVMVMTLIGTFALHPLYARQLIVFGGDGGCFVLGSLLMLTMYARADHPVREERLRWVFLVFGALAFMDARATWFSGPGAVPFGEDGRGFSDPSVLTELYGWSVMLLIDRYTQLATSCFVVLAAVYAAGLVSALNEARTATTASSPRETGRLARKAAAGSHDGDPEAHQHHTHRLGDRRVGQLHATLGADRIATREKERDQHSEVAVRGGGHGDAR
jgi:hypothetical protein